MDKKFQVFFADGTPLRAQGNYAFGAAPVRKFESVEAARAVVAELVAACARYGYSADAERFRAAQIEELV